MKRGDLITVVVSGDHGKPRPGLVVQADGIGSAETVLVCLCTSDIQKIADYRLLVQPTDTNGLRKPSLIQTDKIHSVVLNKCGPVIGCLSVAQLDAVDNRLIFVLGLGG